MIKSALCSTCTNTTVLWAGWLAVFSFRNLSKSSLLNDWKLKTLLDNLIYVMPLTKLWVGIKTCTFRPNIRPFIRTTQNRMCTTPHTPLMDFVHTHTQWPTWHGDDRKYGILRCCKFYMSYRTLSWGASVSYRHISI